MRLLAPEWLAAVWLAPAVALALLWALRARRASARRFAEARTLGALTRRVSRGRPVVRIGMVSLSAALIAVALARPGWNPQGREVVRSGRDVVFVVDVSRSMLAGDLAPSRLERAKIAIRDALGVIEGDRVGLVAFAGTAAVKCPLTLDYGFFRLALDELSPDSVARGGTLIGDALRTTLEEMFDEEEDRRRDIVLITDGEDHESFPVEAAAQAGEMGVRIIAIGLGDPAEGAVVPRGAGAAAPLEHRGEVVVSRLDEETLRRVAGASEGGVYLGVRTGNIDLDEVYQGLIRASERTELESRVAVRYTEGFQALLLAALALLVAESLIGDRRRA